eukprot:TRINITY_DN1944_c0_g1_i1.p1 TRINITY_DN1944_c0_g1~~TRINITY_DN1944_c0_g1_i1.p1  ORF type:complete len:299 (+),score=64.85 TRINITY_DN1944_c0_g1_i1:37-897(+)
MSDDDAPSIKRPKEDPNETDLVTGEKVKEFIDGLKFTQPLSVLQEAEVSKRRECPKCGKSKQYYCYDCVIPLNNKVRARDVKLPVKVHVILHHAEHRGKATSIHSAVLSSDVTLYTHPEIPSIKDPTKSLLVYPSERAQSIEELQAEGILDNIEHLVFVDSTWQQAKGITRDDRVKSLGIPVKLNDYRTLFWRFQNTGDDRFLATIEAIYYLLRDMHAARSPPYSGQYDDLLYFYINQWAVIQRSYIKKKRSFTCRHQKSDSYIKKEIDFSYLLEPPEEKKKATED